MTLFIIAIFGFCLVLGLRGFRVKRRSKHPRYLLGGPIPNDYPDPNRRNQNYLKAAPHSPAAHRHF